MNRLTEKQMLAESDLFRMEMDCELDTVAKWHNKLSQLENIEEELSVELVALFESLRQGIWVRAGKSIRFVKGENLKVEIDCGKPLFASIVIEELFYEDLDGVMAPTGVEWYMDERGETWALTREELGK